jgi:hypothetical protein
MSGCTNTEFPSQDKTTVLRENSPLRLLVCLGFSTRLASVLDFLWVLVVDDRFLEVILSESLGVGPAGSSEDGMTGEAGSDLIVAIKVSD